MREIVGRITNGSVDGCKTEEVKEFLTGLRIMFRLSWAVLIQCDSGYIINMSVNGVDVEEEISWLDCEELRPIINKLLLGWW